MSDGTAIGIALIGSATTVLVSLVNVGLALVNNQRGKRNEDHLVEIKTQTNGMQAELLKVTGESEYAKGVKSETDKQ